MNWQKQSIKSEQWSTPTKNVILFVRTKPANKKQAQNNGCICQAKNPPDNIKQKSSKRTNRKSERAGWNESISSGSFELAMGEFQLEYSWEMEESSVRKHKRPLLLPQCQFHSYLGGRSLAVIQFRSPDRQSGLLIADRLVRSIQCTFFCTARIFKQGIPPLHFADIQVIASAHSHFLLT